MSAFEYTNFKDDLIEYKCLSCKKSYQRKFHEKLKDFLIDTNFLTLITTLFYYYEKVFILTNNQWLWRIRWKNVPQKEDFYSHLNMEDITDTDYAHKKRVCKDFEIKNLGEHHDLYVENDILLLANVFENFRNILCV